MISRWIWQTRPWYAWPSGSGCAGFLLSTGVISKFIAHREWVVLQFCRPGKLTRAKQTKDRVSGKAETRMDSVWGKVGSGDPSERGKLMKKEKHEKTTVTVRLTDEEDQILSRLCILKKTSKTGYLARLAKEQAKQELLRYAAEEYLGGRASLS